MESGSKLRQPFLWLALISATAVAGLSLLCAWGIVWHSGRAVELGWEDGSYGDQSRVIQVDAKGPASGKLQPGDEIVAVNGLGRAAHFGPPQTLIATSRSYSVSFRRHGRLLQVEIDPWVNRAAARNLYSYFLLALLNLALAIWIGAARPDSPAARVAFFLFLGTSMTFGAAAIERCFPPISNAALGLALVMASHAWRPLEWAVAYDFSLRFPVQIRQPKPLRILRLCFYVAGGLLCLIGLLPVIADALALKSRLALYPSWFRFPAVDTWRPLLGDALGALAMLAAPLVLARNYRKLPDVVARTRLRWVALGVSLAILPIALGVLVRFLLLLSGKADADERTKPFLDTFASFATVLMPITLTYAIVKHRVLGIRFVIRRGVQYLLARNGLRLVLYLPLIGIAVDLALHPDEPLRDFLLRKSWWFYIFVIGTALLSLRYRTALRVWVDKRFFRAAYEEEVTLSQFIERLQACETSDEVANSLADQVQETLEPSTVCVLFRNASMDRFTVGHPHDSPLALSFRGFFNERVQNMLQSQRSTRTFSELAASLDEQSSSTLSGDLRNMLATPISSANGELLGVLLLGEKKSEEAYSSRDRRLLQALSTQIALVLEVLGLKERVREEGRVRVEVLGRLNQEQIQLLLECPSCGRCYSAPSTHCSADGNQVGMTLPIERVIDAKYRLERRIGSGGMGAVYQAFDLRLGRMVAVKVMTGRLFGNSVALRRFEREARTIARLQHPNIVTIYDFGSLRGDGAYLVMQLLSGISWRTELSEHGEVRGSRACEWFDQLCEAVAYAHANGIMHRDLKPENVLLSDSSEGVEKITVVDFGLAKLHALDEAQELMVSTQGAVLGTRGYMSPEQRSGQPVDERTDIYSIGVMVAETLTNSAPPAFGASDEWLNRVLPMAESVAVFGELKRLLQRCLTESLADRLRNVRELQRELIPLLRACPRTTGVRVTGMGNDVSTLPS